MPQLIQRGGKSYILEDDGSLTETEASPKDGFSEEQLTAAANREGQPLSNIGRALLMNEARKELGITAADTGLLASPTLATGGTLPSSVGGMSTLGGETVMVADTGEVIGSATPEFIGGPAVGTTQAGLSTLGTALSLAAIAKGGYDFYKGLEAQKHGRKNQGGGAMSGAMMGGGIGTLIAPGIGTVIGAGAGALAGLLGGSITGGRHKDWYARNTYRDAMKESGILDNQWALTLSDGSRVDFSSDHGPDDSGFREYEVDTSATPYTPEATTIGTAFNVLLNGYGQDEIADQYAGYFTNAFMHNTRTLDDVKRNAAFVSLKNGMTPAVMQQRLEALKGTMDEQTYAVMQRAVSDIGAAQQQYYSKELSAMSSSSSGSTPIAPQTRPFDSAGSGPPAFVARGALSQDGARSERIVTKGADGKNIYQSTEDYRVSDARAAEPDSKDETHQQMTGFAKAFHNIIGDPADKDSPQYTAQQLLNTSGTLEEAKGSLAQALGQMGITNEAAVGILQQKKAQGLLNESDFNSSLYALGTLSNTQGAAKPALPSAKPGQYEKGTLPPMAWSGPLDLQNPKSPETPKKPFDPTETPVSPWTQEMKGEGSFSLLGDKYTVNTNKAGSNAPILAAQTQSWYPKKEEAKTSPGTAATSSLYNVVTNPTSVASNPYGFLKYLNGGELSDSEISSMQRNSSTTVGASDAEVEAAQKQAEAEAKKARQQAAADSVFARQESRKRQAQELGYDIAMEQMGVLQNGQAQSSQVPVNSFLGAFQQ